MINEAGECVEKIETPGGGTQKDGGDSRRMTGDKADCVKRDPAAVTYDMVAAAYKRCRGYVKRTPLVRAERLEKLFGGAEIYFKTENLQYTGSFKMRGVSNKMMSLSRVELSRGVAASSSGNHAQAVAYMASLLGAKAVIVMPEDAPSAKIDGTRAYGADLIFCGLTAGEREQKCAELIEERGYSLVHTYADVDIIAGHGALALEAIEQARGGECGIYVNGDCGTARESILFDEIAQPCGTAREGVFFDEIVLPCGTAREGILFDEIVLPCGAGAIVSGCAVATKGASPETVFTAVEPAIVARFTASLKAGRPVAVEPANTIADGLRAYHADPLNFTLIRDNVDRMLTAGEASIRRAAREIALRAGLVAEPSACVGIAAALEGSIDMRAGRRVCFVLTGGNMDTRMLADIMS